MTNPSVVLWAGTVCLRFPYAGLDGWSRSAYGLHDVLLVLVEAVVCMCNTLRPCSPHTILLQSIGDAIPSASTFQPPTKNTVPFELSKNRGPRNP
eukprot:1916117-Amphidinium_carterae.1